MDRDEREMALLQYREVYQTFRFHDSAFWQSLSVIAAVDIGGITAIFNYIADKWVRFGALWVPLLVTLAVAVMLVRHRYFGEIEQETLSALEDALAYKRVLRTGEDHQDSSSARGYWVNRPCSTRYRSSGTEETKVVAASRFSSQWLMILVAWTFVFLLSLLMVYSLAGAQMLEWFWGLAFVNLLIITVFYTVVRN